MKSQTAKDFIDKIDIAINDINGFSSITPLEESYLAKFLVVYICGIYEETIEIIINEMVGRLGSSEISKFIRTSLKRGFHNPSTGKVKFLMKSFSDVWGDVIVSLPFRAKDALTSIVNNKNAIAHGVSVSLNLRDVISYYNNSKVVIEKIDDTLL